MRLGLFVSCALVMGVRSASPPFFEWEHALWTHHNSLRSRVANGLVDQQPAASNMEEVLYETSLQTVTLSHALQCRYELNNGLQREVDAIADELSFRFSALDQFGENIAWAPNGQFLSSDVLQDIIQQQWFDDEYPYYVYAHDQCNSSDVDVDCNAYRNLAFARTRYMACGVSICPSLYFPDSDTVQSNAAFIVCNYWPSYDADEVPIYQQATTTTTTSDGGSAVVAQTCTQCPLDRSSQCNQGLCAGCPAPNYNFCQDRLASVCPTVQKEHCGVDIIAQLYCPFTCYCSASDLLPASQCDELYLTTPTSSPTLTPTSVYCHRIGWYTVAQIEADPSLRCSDGYSLPSAQSIPFVQLNCLNTDDATHFETVLPGTDIEPYGIALEWVRYDMGCEWDTSYSQGVVVTHTGIKCGDRAQLFICVADHVVVTTPTAVDYASFLPTMTTVSAPTIAAPTRSPTDKPTDKPTFAPTPRPTREPTHIDATEAPTSSPTQGPTHSPTVEPTTDPTKFPTTSPSASPSLSPTTLDPTLSPSAAPQVVYDPFRMYLIFPDAVNSAVIDGSGGQTVSVPIMQRRRLLSSRQIELYPTNGVAVSLPMQSRFDAYGYQFLLQPTDANSNTQLTQVLYAVDIKSCGSRSMPPEEWIQFRGFEKTKGSWSEVLSIDYDVRLEQAKSADFVEVVIDIRSPNIIKKSVAEYMLMIDVSMWLKECASLAHLSYAKTFGHHFVHVDNFNVTKINAVAMTNTDEITTHKYWVPMRIKLE